MQKFWSIITFPLSVLYWMTFFLILIVFHGFQWIAFNIFGYTSHKKVVDVMNFFIIKAMYIAGVRYRLNGNPQRIPIGPNIIISNHQSMFDIPPLIWYLKRLHPKFIAKKELGKGVPGISYNLRHGGSVLIDRSNRASAMKGIISIGNYIAENDRAVVIFPEGTRSKDGVPKNWKKGGLMTLFQTVPNATVIPVTINGSWKILKNGGWPIPFGTTIDLTIHEPMTVLGQDAGEFISRIEAIVNAGVVQ